MEHKIIDVARKAGVSPATVSRVLNGSELVAEATRNKVLESVHSLGYVPHAAAKQLRSRKTMALGVIVPDINNSQFALAIKGIEQAAYARQYRMMICDASNSARKERDYIHLLTDHTVDGMIWIASRLGDEELAELADKGFQIGLIYRKHDHPRIHHAVTNNDSFSLEVMIHLHEQGHRDIAFISGSPDIEDSYERLQGYIHALRTLRLPFRPELIENGDFSEEGGYAAMRRLLDKQAGMTAVYCANDEIAFGVYTACQEHGLAIPRDIAVVGVDNQRLCRYLNPPLTSVEQPNFYMGETLAESLIAQIDDGGNGGAGTCTADSKLIVRESSLWMRR